MPVRRQEHAPIKTDVPAKWMPVRRQEHAPIKTDVPAKWMPVRRQEHALLESPFLGVVAGDSAADFYPAVELVVHYRADRARFYFPALFRGRAPSGGGDDPVGRDPGAAALLRAAAPHLASLRRRRRADQRRDPDDRTCRH